MPTLNLSTFHQSSQKSKFFFYHLTAALGFVNIAADEAANFTRRNHRPQCWAFALGGHATPGFSGPDRCPALGAELPCE
jgi:hypothetical protein